MLKLVVSKNYFYSRTILNVICEIGVPPLVNLSLFHPFLYSASATKGIRYTPNGDSIIHGLHLCGFRLEQSCGSRCPNLVRKLHMLASDFLIDLTVDHAGPFG
jgi:hypothetical protein